MATNVPNPLASGAAASDLGLGAASDTIKKTQAELEEMKRRRKLFGKDPAISPAVMSLTGNQY